MTSAPDAAPPSPPAAAPPSPPDGPAIHYFALPHPWREGTLLFYDPDEVVSALAAARGGARPRRIAYGAATAPEESEVRALETGLRRGFLGRARRQTGWALWWLCLGPALSLLLVNLAGRIAILFAWLPPLAVLIASLGAVSGGPVLAGFVALFPLVWAWRKALARARDARAWGARAAALGSRRAVPPDRAVHPDLAVFSTQAATPASQLRAVVPRLADEGAGAAGEAARASRTVYRLATRHTLPAVAGAFHALYRLFENAEQRLARLDQGGSGVLAERKAAQVGAKTARAAAAGLQAFAPHRRVGTGTLRPVFGLAAGVLALGLTLLLTGTYFVDQGEAVILDPPAARLARMALAAGVGGGAAEQADVPEVVQDPGMHWTWPGPFSARHTVTLEGQRARLRAIFRQTGPDSFDVLFVGIEYNIADARRWAEQDQDGNGDDRLSAALSQILENVIQQQRRDARQAVAQQNPSLPDDQVAQRADQLVQGRLDDLVRAFVSALSSAQAIQESGVQVTGRYQSQLVTGVPATVAGATTNG